tara:strand:- start:40 stop:417 length:378 start_codon:yes stop_codon:yes gene_type:complete
MFEKNRKSEINALTNGLVRKFDINQDVPVPKSEEAYEIWFDQMGYADVDELSEEAGPSYEEWLHMEEMKDEEKAQRKESYEVLHEAALNYNEDIVSSILDLKDAAKAWVRAVDYETRNLMKLKEN